MEVQLKLINDEKFILLDCFIDDRQKEETKLGIC